MVNRLYKWISDSGTKAKKEIIEKSNTNTRHNAMLLFVDFLVSISTSLPIILSYVTSFP